jgi:hypothetical protein
VAIAVTRRAGAQRVGALSHAITLAATANVDDLIILALALKTGTSNSITSVSGLGATWSKITSGTATGANSRIELWRGVVVTAGTAITVTPSASLALTWDAFQITGYDPATPIQASSTDGTASADTTSDTTYGLGSPAPTNAANVVIDAASIAATAAISFSSLTAGWTQGMAFGGSSTLHPAYSAYRTNMGTGAAAAQVTGTVAAVNGYAWVVINEAPVAAQPYEISRINNAVYRM